MANNEEQIKNKVIIKLSQKSKFSVETIIPEKRLEKDLYLFIDYRGDLAPDFESIDRENNPKAVISKAECKELTTVKECIDLVTNRSKVKGS